MDGIRQLLVYADDIGRNINTMNKNTEALLDISKEDDLEVCEEKTFASSQHSTGQNYIRINI
jgi:hypothetical protein